MAKSDTNKNVVYCIAEKLTNLSKEKYLAVADMSRIYWLYTFVTNRKDVTRALSWHEKTHFDPIEWCNEAHRSGSISRVMQDRIIAVLLEMQMSQI